MKPPCLPCLSGMLLLLFIHSAHALPYQTPAASAGAGGIVTVLDDPGSACAGIAGLADISGKAAGMAYHDLYGLSELAMKHAFVVTSLQPETAAAHWTGAFEVMHSGYAVFSETLAGLMLAGRLGPCLRAGVRWDMEHVSVAGENGALHLLGAFGLRLHASERHTAGLLVSNLTLADRSRLPSAFRYTGIRAGYSVKMADNAVTCMEWERYNADWEWQAWRFGFLFLPVERLVLRCGFICRPQASVSLGCGCRFRGWEADLAASSHTLLGEKISVSICKSWK